MKVIRNGNYIFMCNGCQEVAGMNPSESDALKNARELATRYNWVWRHPHWGLYCPNCK